MRATISVFSIWSLGRVVMLNFAEGTPSEDSASVKIKMLLKSDINQGITSLQILK